MSFFKRVGKAAKKVVKVAAVAAAVYYTGGAALTLYAKNRQDKANAQAPQPVYLGGPDNNPYYSAPFNPGYSYTGGPGDFAGAGGMTYSGSGAAIPIQQSGGQGAPGFTLSPMMLLIGVVALFGGILLLRR